MKKFKIALPFMAFIIAIATSAFTMTSKEAGPESFQQDLHWYSVLNGTPEYDGFQTKAEEKALTGCEDETTVVCARGYTESQLVNGDPEQGPINFNVYSDQIMRTNQ